MPSPEPRFVQLRAAHIEVDVRISARPERVWHALTVEIGQWWPATFSVKPERLKSFQLEPNIGGLIYEDWGTGSGWVWWTIFEWNPADRTFAATGFLDTATATTAVRFVVDEGPQGDSVVRISERVWGEIPVETETSHKHGWTELMEGSFKPYVEAA